MRIGSTGRRNARLLLVSLAGLLALPARSSCSRRRGPGGPPPSPKAAAPIDLTGYWVSVVTEDWRYRMVTPAKGDYLSVPMNAESKRVADAWDPAKDEAAGEQCKSYGAAGIMRLPERVHITWQDDNTLRMDIDAGTQTRLFHFGGLEGVGRRAHMAGRFGGAVGISAGAAKHHGTASTSRWSAEVGKSESHDEAYARRLLAQERCAL